MTIKEEYKLMKSELRTWNKRSFFDETPYLYHIEHHSKKAKTEMFKLLNRDFEIMNRDMELGIISVEKYNELWKVWNDCSTSIANMIII